jgi:hypothetical protein
MHHLQPICKTCHQLQNCQRTKAKHGGPRGLLYPLPLPSRRGRVFATQFHPEKSQAKGLRIYRNFAAVAAGG